MGNEDPSMGNEVVRVYGVTDQRFGVLRLLCYRNGVSSRICFSAMFLSRTSQKLN